MTTVLALAALAVGLVLGFFFARFLSGRSTEGPDNREAEARALVETAKAEAEALRKDAEVKGKEIAFKLKKEADDELRARQAELSKKEEALANHDETLQKKQKTLSRKEDEVAKREGALTKGEADAESARKETERLVEEAKAKLESVAGMTAAEARQTLTDQSLQEARIIAAAEIKRLQEATELEAAEKSKTIIATAIQRYAGEYVGERTVTVVALPSDDLKGRLIGREGRNVRALEAATGVDMIIDDTPEAITISCFNPVRRHIAHQAINKLLSDGRIHPTRIEELVEKAEKNVNEECKEAGEQAVFDLGIHRVHPELVTMLGSLKFRSSATQNLLQHSVEVGYLSGLIAGELGLNVKQARRAGLFHDIGKAVDHEHDGDHSEVGARLLKRLGESPKVWQAVAAHHHGVPAASVLDHIVDAANVLSSSRPGARREQLGSYVKRLTDLEKLAESYEGVKKAFAIQAGRELRVIVENSTLGDEQCVILARDLAKRIEDEMSYPGQVRVSVLRETRATEYAR